MGIVIIGTGGLAKELHGMLANMGEWVIGFIAEKMEGGDPYFCGLPVLGIDAWFIRQPSKNAVIANGSPRVRRKLSEYYQASAHNFPWLIHPRAIIFSDLAPGAGSVIMPGALVEPEVRIGRHVFVSALVFVGHDTEIGDYSVINHRAGLSGNCHIGRGVLIGAGATVLENRTVGDGATVGAGATVTRDIPPGETWVGCPAKPMIVKVRANGQT